LTKYILDHIPFRTDLPAFLRRARISAESPYVEEAKAVLAQAEAVARPKAIYGVGFIDDRGEDWVAIEGVRFTSRVLRVNLEGAHRVFAYVATCGIELHEWAAGQSDLLERYWADAIAEMALRSATRALSAHIEDHFLPGRTSAMAPGSLGEWPLSEQRPLFALLGNVSEAIGVRLGDSLLMTPTKSVSGIRFPTEESFESCMLCPRPGCPGRRAPYNRDLFDVKYRPPS
jgi:hypothetical protein